jgi:hypothetical protein
MFCTRCGANNLDADQFCRSCSSPLVKPGGAQQGQPVSSGSPQQPYPYSSPYPSPGPGQQQQPPQGYPGYQGYPQQQQYGYGAQMPIQQGGASGRAISALVLSIISFVTCCLPVGIIGIVLGKMEMNAIQEGRASRAGESLAQVGFYRGIVATALSLLVGGLYFLGALASIAGNNY